MRPCPPQRRSCVRRAAAAGASAGRSRRAPRRRPRPRLPTMPPMTPPTCLPTPPSAFSPMPSIRPTEPERTRTETRTPPRSASGTADRGDARHHADQHPLGQRRAPARRALHAVAREAPAGRPSVSSGRARTGPPRRRTHAAPRWPAAPAAEAPASAPPARPRRCAGPSAGRRHSLLSAASAPARAGRASPASHRVLWARMVVRDGGSPFAIVQQFGTGLHRLRLSCEPDLARARLQ